MALQIIKLLKSTIAGNRPSGRAYGEPYVNLADLQFGIVNNAAQALDLMAVRFFSTIASYNVGDFVQQGGQLYRSKITQLPGVFTVANWDQVTTATAVGAGYLPLTGGTLTGPVTMNAQLTMNAPIVLSGNPTAALMAVPMQYVDNLTNSIMDMGTF